MPKLRVSAPIEPSNILGRRVHTEWTCEAFEVLPGLLYMEAGSRTSRAVVVSSVYQEPPDRTVLDPITQYFAFPFGTEIQVVEP